MNKEKFLQTGLLEQYILGLTSPEEDRLVEEHLQAFPELQEEVNQLHNALNNYATQQLEPSMSTGAGLSPMIADNRLPNRYQTRFHLALVACLILAALSTFLYRSFAAQRESMSHLQAEHTTLQEKYALQMSSHRDRQEIYELMQAPTTKAVILQAIPTISQDYFAIAYWNADKQAGWLDPTHLPALAADEQYYVWADVHEEMIPIGHIAANARSPITINYQEEAISINITREKLGTPDLPNLGGLIVSSPIVPSITDEGVH